MSAVYDWAMGLSERFWPKVNKTAGCWFWQGARYGNGYGQIRGEDGRTIPAHRAALLLSGVDIEGKVVHHRCHERACVNPEHLVVCLSQRIHARHHRKHSPASVIRDIQNFHAEYGRPPVAGDWNASLSRKLGHHDRVKAWEEHEWPPLIVVQKLFGSWSTAIEVAGFPRPHLGRPPRK